MSASTVADMVLCGVVPSENRECWLMYLPSAQAWPRLLRLRLLAILQSDMLPAPEELVSYIQILAWSLPEWINLPLLSPPIYQSFSNASCKTESPSMASLLLPSMILRPPTCETPFPAACSASESILGSTKTYLSFLWMSSQWVPIWKSCGGLLGLLGLFVLLMAKSLWNGKQAAEHVLKLRIYTVSSTSVSVLT